MKAIKLSGRNNEGLQELLNQELVLSVAKATELTFKNGEREEKITMLTAQQRMRKARENASYFYETSKHYAMHMTVAKFYGELVKQFRAETINNDEWRQLALSEVENKSELLKVVLDYNFEEEVDKDTREFIEQQTNN